MVDKPQIDRYNELNKTNKTYRNGGTDHQKRKS